MAGIRIEGKQYVARVHFPKGHRPSEVKIPLRTLNEKTARIRRIEVERHADDIKSGIDVTFPWLNDDDKVGVRHYDLEQLVSDYMKAKKAEGISEGTVGIATLALEQFKKVLSKRFPVDQIKTQHIDQFKQDCRTKKLAGTTMNIRLRNIRTALRWAFDRNRISHLPIVKEVMVPKGPPKYFSNTQFDDICEQVDEFLAEVFWFYRESGCRLSEPFYGEINGDFLTIQAETAKSRRSRDIHLTSRMKSILLKIRKKTHLKEEAVKNRKHRSKTHDIKHYSRMFKAACVDAGINDHRFHDLRHTAAVRKYLNTRDIYEVARLLGHSSVNTTSIYTRFDIKRLEQDFSDLVKPTLKVIKKKKLAS